MQGASLDARVNAAGAPRVLFAMGRETADATIWPDWLETEDAAMARWQLQEAKNRLSELVRKARDEGPQVITLHGRDAAVVVSASDYARRAKPRGSLVDFIRKSPLAGAALEVGRSRDTGRPVRL